MAIWGIFHSNQNKLKEKCFKSSRNKRISRFAMQSNLSKQVAQTRMEVMREIEGNVSGYIGKYLIPVESIWQPTDFLPDSKSSEFTKTIALLREEAMELDYDFWIVLIGDMITEEALPSYESWLMGVDGIDQIGKNHWSSWVRQWTAEENRHGDVLKTFLYLCGRINMKEVEK